MGQIYQVPIVSNGLRETESILQIVDSLDKLEKVFNDIYSNITNRVLYEKARIDSVGDRLDNAQHKVNQIIGSKSAITVFSSAKFPSDKKWLDYKPLNNGRVKLPYKPSHYHGLHHENDIKKMNPEDSFLDVNDLVFIEKSIDAASKEIENKEGLGKLPNHLPSVSNLLLFNTQENPYKKYSNTLDNLAGASGEEQLQIFGEQIQQPQRRKIGDAPVTVELGDNLIDVSRENYKFSHSNFIKPSYDFPSDLPLPNIAANIGWQNNENTTIAPSNQNTSTILPIYDQQQSQPNTNNTIDINTPGLAIPSSQPQSSIAQPNSLNNSSVPPPPPPPPMPNSNNTSLPIPSHSNIAPPPPSLTTNLVDDIDPSKDEETSDGTTFGNLLADIRKGHKTRLKKVDNDSNGDPSSEPPPPPKSSGGDIMSDLFLTLARRRESIASTKKKVDSKKEQYSDDSDGNESDWDDK